MLRLQCGKSAWLMEERGWLLMWSCLALFALQLLVGVLCEAELVVQDSAFH